MTVTSPLVAPISRRRAWIVFALVFALMVSDYMTRSVISAVLPDLKAQWGLSDGQLGLLVGIVPLIVGIGAWPIALLADRIGYVRSITAMSAAWCVATVLCGLSQTPTQLLIARAAVGLGEAGYGPVGAAALSGVFPKSRRSAILGAFQAAAVLGSVLGVVVGGVIGHHHGWQAAFIWIGAVSLVLVAFFPLLVREPPRARDDTHPSRDALPLGATMRALFASASARYAYVASGLQMLVLAVLGAWMPTFLTREYGLPTDQAAMRAGLVLLMIGVGMIVGGVLADRSPDGRRRLQVASGYTAASFVLLASAFALPPGAAQMALLVVGATAAGAHSGIVISAVVELTDPRVRATGIATVALFNNLLGLAPGPYLVGVLSDAFSLKSALAIVPVAGLVASAFFLLAARDYRPREESMPGGRGATANPSSGSAPARDRRD